MREQGASGPGGTARQTGRWRTTHGTLVERCVPPAAPHPRDRGEGSSRVARICCRMDGALGAAVGHEIRLLEIDMVIAPVPIHAEDMDACRARLRLQCIDENRPGGGAGTSRGGAAVVLAAPTQFARREVCFRRHVAAVLSN